jgi:hypothetical protein
MTCLCFAPPSPGRAAPFMYAHPRSNSDHPERPIWSQHRVFPPTESGPARCVGGLHPWNHTAASRGGSRRVSDGRDKRVKLPNSHALGPWIPASAGMTNGRNDGSRATPTLQLQTLDPGSPLRSPGLGSGAGSWSRLQTFKLQTSQSLLRYIVPNAPVGRRQAWRARHAGGSTPRFLRWGRYQP